MSRVFSLLLLALTCLPALPSPLGEPTHGIQIIKDVALPSRYVIFDTWLKTLPLSSEADEGESLFFDMEFSGTVTFPELALPSNAVPRELYLWGWLYSPSVPELNYQWQSVQDTCVGSPCNSFPTFFPIRFFAFGLPKLPLAKFDSSSNTFGIDGINLTSHPEIAASLLGEEPFAIDFRFEMGHGLYDDPVPGFNSYTRAFSEGLVYPIVHVELDILYDLPHVATPEPACTIPILVLLAVLAVRQWWVVRAA